MAAGGGKPRCGCDMSGDVAVVWDSGGKELLEFLDTGG